MDVANSPQSGAENYQIKARRLNFRFSSELPKFWHGGDPFKTHFFNALSTFLPAGEAFFMASVRDCIDQIENKNLKHQARGFIGQEACHSNAHVEYNRWLSRLGYPAEIFEHRQLADISKAKSRRSIRYQLALAVAGEHFTAIMANRLLAQPESLIGAHHDIAELWRWHAAEEIEHKSVVFDVYQAISGGYWVRCVAMFLFSLVSVFQFTHRFSVLLKQDGKLFNIKLWASGLNFLFGKPGVLRKMIPDYLSYYRPAFHPWDQQNWNLVKPLIFDYDASNSTGPSARPDSIS